MGSFNRQRGNSGVFSRFRSVPTGRNRRGLHSLGRFRQQQHLPDNYQRSGTRLPPTHRSGNVSVIKFPRYFVSKFELS